MHRVVVLAYHQVRSRGDFEQHLKILGQISIPGSPAELHKCGPAISRQNRTRVLLTFDDLDYGHIEVGAPLLHKRGWPAVAFVVAESIRNGFQPWWVTVDDWFKLGIQIAGFESVNVQAAVTAMKLVRNRTRLRIIDEMVRPNRALARSGTRIAAADLRELERRGVEVGNHTLNHPILPRCTDGEVDREIRGAHEVIADALGHNPRYFAFPNGNHDPRAVRVLRELGYEGAFIFDHRVQRSPVEDRFKISRVRISADAGKLRTRLLVSGAHSGIWRVAGRFRTAPARKRAERLARQLETLYGDSTDSFSPGAE